MHDGIDNAKCSPENKEIVRNALHERTIRLLNASKESSAPSHLSNGPNEKEEADERRPSQGSQTKARKKGREKKEMYVQINLSMQTIETLIWLLV